MNLKSFCGIFIFLIFILKSFVFAGINFSSQSSQIQLNNNAKLNLRNIISNWSGTLQKVTGGTITGQAIIFDDGILDEEDAGNRFSGTYRPNENIKIFLGGNKSFKASPGTSLNKINVHGSGNKLQGQPIFSNSDSIRLENENTELFLGISIQLDSDIEMRNGTLKLDSDLRFADDRILTGSGFVDFRNHSLTFRSKNDLTLTHSIFWQGAADINLNSKVSLSGTWTFGGNSVLNGHGNVLDLTNGGTLYINKNASLSLTDVVVKGLGIDKGWLVFQDHSSTISVSNVTFELENRFTTTIGKIYIEGPATAVVKNYDWTFDDYSTLSVDGITLWKDYGSYAGLNEGNIVFSDIEKNKGLISGGEISGEISDDYIINNSNAIITNDREIGYNSDAIVWHDDQIRWNSNAIISLDADQSALIRANSNAIITNDREIGYNSDAIVWHDDQIRWNSNAIVSLDADQSALIRANSNAIVSAIKIYDTSQTYANDTTLENLVFYKAGFTVNVGKTLTLNTPLEVRGKLSLLGTLKLDGDLYLGSGATLFKGGEINGNGRSIHLSDNLYVPANQVLHLSGNTVIEGHGNTLTLSENAQLFVDTDVSVTLRNLVINSTRNGLGNSPVKCTASSSKLSLDNVKLAFQDDFNFDIGRLFFNNDVCFTGTNSFFYYSTNPSYIKSKSKVTFEPNTTFNFRPATDASRELINLEDKSSRICLNGCTLKTTHTGLRLTKGSLTFDNKVSLTSAAALKIIDLSGSLASLDFGTGVNAVSWRPDGKFVAVAGSGENLSIYSFDGNSLTLVDDVSDEGAFLSVSWSLDGKYLILGTNTGRYEVLSFDGSSLSYIDGVSYSGIPNIYSVTFSPDNKYVAVAGSMTNYQLYLYSFDGNSLTETFSLDYGTDIRSVDWHPDGDKFLIGGNGHDANDFDWEIYRFNGYSDIGTYWQRIAQYNFGGTGSTVYSVAWNPDGRYFATGFDNGTNHYAEILGFGGNSISNLDVRVSYGNAAYSVDWFNDGRYIIVGGDNSGNDITIYQPDIDNFNLISITTKSFGNSAKSVKFSNDAIYVLAGGDNSPNDVQVYQVQQGPDTNTQAVSSSIIFGNSILGSDYNVDIRLLSGAFVSVDGILNIDNTVTTSIFDNDVSKFVLKDSNSKIKLASANVNGFVDRSIMKQISGRGFGDYNLLSLDSGSDDIIDYSEASVDLLISNSNAIVTHDREIDYNSSAILNLDVQIKDNSNAIVWHDDQIRWNSNAIVTLDTDQSALIRANSNA
ncbi:MAG: hypothetical protein GF317_12715, partial [Candidatus Lokiarchaeota archaeon]|nr:hypothetical protein [Candidatus Lokiarchaeota archaeon]